MVVGWRRRSCIKDRIRISKRIRTFENQKIVHKEQLFSKIKNMWNRSLNESAI